MPTAHLAPLLDRIRDCVRAAGRRGLSPYALAKKADVNRSQISRLMHGTNALLVPTAEAIVRAAGYDILIVRREDD
jgi:transcriptional regulator with XRE-family HTH domain